MIGGNSETDILEAIASNFPHSDPAQLLEEAVTHFLKVGTLHQGALIATFGWCLESTKDLYRRMVEIGDFPSALRAIKQIKDLANEAATLQGGEDVRDEGQGRSLRAEEAAGSDSSA